MPVSTVPSAGLTSPLASTVTTTATVTTLNAPSGVLATQNGMTGIAKAWVAYNGTTQTILGSFNVSSVTYVGTGNYTINLTTAMANSNYSTVATGNSWAMQCNPLTSSTIQVQPYRTDTQVSTNVTSASVAVFGT